MTNHELIRAIQLLESIANKNSIAYMTLKKYREELNARCKKVFSDEK